MFVPFVFTLDNFDVRTPDYFFFVHFYRYSDACIQNGWPIISHERYFEKLTHVEETIFGVSMQDIVYFNYLSKVPTTNEMLKLKTYPILQEKEDELIAKYKSQLDCWVDLQKNDNLEFEELIGEQLDKIIVDFGEKPEGVLILEYLPKALLAAAQKRDIPVIYQVGAVLRRPFARLKNGFCLINSNSGGCIESKYKRFMIENDGLQMLSRKGILRLFGSERHMMNIHNIDNEPKYDVGVVYHSFQEAAVVAYHRLSDEELSVRVRRIYDNVLIRSRPGFEKSADATDDSATFFDFCCKCKRIVGNGTKGLFEAMLAGRIAHDYDAGFFLCFCNDGIEDESKGVAPIEFLNFVLFGLCIPYQWITDPEYLRFLLSNPSEKDQYMCSFEFYTHDISREDLEFYYMSDNREYRLGDPLYFTIVKKPHECASYYCTEGLHYHHGDHTWSKGESTSFEFDLIEKVSEPLLISIALYEVVLDWNLASPLQTVTCEVNGTDCGSVELIPGKKYLRFTIPEECIEDKLRITFRYSYLNPSSDTKFAVAFERMYISRLNQRPIENEILKEMSNETARLAGEIEQKSNTIVHLEYQIQQIYNSRSWKIGNALMRAAAKIISQK